MAKSIKRTIGDLLFKAITAIPGVHGWLNKSLVSQYTDNGPLPGLYTTEGDGQTSLHELLNKEHFALEVPKPTAEQIKDLPDIEKLVALFERKNGAESEAKESRVSLLLPFFAQHLTDAVFQSKGDTEIETDAPHEIILNQIYGNTKGDELALRSMVDGKLKTRQLKIHGKDSEFPDALCHEVDGSWQVKKEYQQLSYLSEKRLAKLLASYKGREQELCAVGLFQGNMTLGNFAITTLLVREHNRLCEGVEQELTEKGLPVTDELIFKKAQQINITTYMKLVIEDYINTFAGQKIFKLDTKSFFYEKQRWCRESPIPFHFNILYRFHGMIPDTLKGHETLGFGAYLANNGLVMNQGLGPVFELASSQAASPLNLGNTHKALLAAEKAMLEKGRRHLGSFNAHREAQQAGSSLQFSDFDPAFQQALSELYGGDVNKLDYAVGIFAELPKKSWVEKIGFTDDSFLGSTIMGAIGKHAFRHILSNRFMSREFLNPQVMTEFGWETLQTTDSVEQLVKRNIPEMSASEVAQLEISFDAPAHRKGRAGSRVPEPATA